MTHEEQRLWMIRELQKEKTRLSNREIPDDEQGQKNLLRGLMNIRLPKPLSDEYIKVTSKNTFPKTRRYGIIESSKDSR